ncbi:hypothetical protein VCV18_010427 [Metarhizium anisopliae]
MLKYLRRESETKYNTTIRYITIHPDKGPSGKAGTISSLPCFHHTTPDGQPSEFPGGSRLADTTGHSKVLGAILLVVLGILTEPTLGKGPPELVVAMKSDHPSPMPPDLRPSRQPELLDLPVR